MNLSDGIQVFVSVVALILSYVAIRQTKKSIQEANRPYVVAYFTSIKVTATEQIVIVIRNYGQTGANIDSIEISPDITHKNELGFLNNAVKGNPFKNIRNHFLAPGQSIKALVGSQGDGMMNIVESRKIIINYHDSSSKKYKELLEFDEFEWSRLLQHPRVSTNHSSKDVVRAIKNLEQTISHTAQETITHKL